MYSSVINDNYDTVKEKATEERLSPSEKINLASNPTFKTEVIEVSSTKSGKDIYNWYTEQVPENTLINK